MKVTIKTADLIKELEDALKLSDKNYQKAANVYLAKLTEYLKYVEKQLKSEKRLTKPAPYLSEWSRQDLIQALEALKMHQSITVEIDDRELSNLKSGIQRLREVAEESITSLTTLAY